MQTVSIVTAVIFVTVYSALAADFTQKLEAALAAL